jgi:hypothetical protein
MRLLSLLIFLTGLTISAADIRAQTPFDLIIPEGTTLCEIGKNGPIGIAQETLAQIDLVSGTIELRTDVETFEAELIEELRIGAPDRIAQASGPGIFKRYSYPGGRFDFQFDQQFVLGESTYDLTFSVFEFQAGDPPLAMEGVNLRFGERFYLNALWDETWLMEFAPCYLEGQRGAWVAKIEGDRRVEVNFRIIQQNACGSWVTVPSARLHLPDLSDEIIEQRDYWKLITWSTCHFFEPDGMRILFDSPFGEVHGIGVNRDYITGVTAEYLDENYEAIQIFDVSSETYAIVDSLFLNEVMADNRTTLQDEAGDFDPWIEIYNPHDYFVDLKGVGLTDDLEDPGRWVFPSGAAIDAGGFLVVWTDGEPEEGPLHTSFRLDPGGGEIGLFNRYVYGDEEWDRIEFGAQSADRSIGRIPDGTGNVVLLETSSPGASNETVPATPTPTTAPTPTATFETGRADLDGDGEIDARDLLILISDWSEATDGSDGK